MTWDDFTRVEKIAIMRSALAVARCNYNPSLLGGLFRRAAPKHNVNDAQNLYLNILLIRMNGRGDANSFMNAVNSMQDKEMANTIKQMYQEKRDLVFLIWASVLCRISGSTYFGSMSMSDFPSEYNSTVEAMARDMNVIILRTFDIDDNGYY
ncbi:MAG: hypothetical protein IJK41_08860 [Muribaculaceae bacterium]|nr:hypothetical protein [Muribaculaceae bacterium]